MKKRSVIFLQLCLVILLTSCSKNFKTIKEKKGSELEKITLNRIAMSAAENPLEKVELEKTVEKEIDRKDCVEIYSIKPKEYNVDKLNEILDACFNDKIKSVDDDDEMDIYLLEKGGSLTYYKNSGGLSYSSTMDGNYDSSENRISDEELIRIAEDFIIKSKIFDLDDLLFDYVKPAMYVEDGEKEKIERYEVNFQKKPLEGFDGYVGSQLGISVEIGCNGVIIGFVSFDRDIETTGMEYPSKNIDEIKNDIIRDKNVMLDFEENVDEAEFSDVKYVLYCDSVLEKQKYAVPHYEMIDEDNKVVAVLPAIEDKYLTIK